MCHTHVDCLERMNDRENKNANLKKQERIEEKRLIFVTYLLHSWQCGRYFGNKLSIYSSQEWCADGNVNSSFLEEESESE